MPSTYTQSLRLEEQGIGENIDTWGERLNRTIRFTDAAVAGVATIATTGGTTVLTAVNNEVDQARNRILKITGNLSSNVTLQVPEVSKEYIVWDTTTRNGNTVSLRLGGSGAVFPVSATLDGEVVATDGTSWVGLSAADVDLSGYLLRSEWNPTTPQLVWSGNSNSVLMSSLSSSGPGGYIAIRNGGTQHFFIMVRDVTAQAFGTARTESVGTAIFGLNYTPAAGFFLDGFVFETAPATVWTGPNKSLSAIYKV